MKFFTLTLLLFLGAAYGENTREQSEARKYLRDANNFECSWETPPTTVDWYDEKAYSGTVKCRFFPKNDSAKSLPVEERVDHRFAAGCKVDPSDSTYPNPLDCELRNDSSEPKFGSLSNPILDEKELTNAQKQALQKDLEEGKQKFGSCKTINDPSSMALVFQYQKSFSLLCASPVNCEGGLETPPGGMAICEKLYKKVIPTMNKYSKKMENITYPVCPPPEACLVRSQRDPNLKIVSNKKASNSAVGHIRRAKRSDLDNQFASALAPSGRDNLFLKSGVTHITQ